MWNRLKREPLAHFIALGAIIFVASRVVADVRSDALDRIVVDRALEERIVRLQSVQTGVEPRGPELASLVDRYVDDEVLYREALRLGLDQGDEIIRRRLIQKIEFLQEDSAPQNAPSEAELRAYYESHRAQFVQPVPRYEEIEPEVRADYLSDAATRARRTQLDTLRARYRVERAQ
jgi:hypothetical protein